MNELVQGTEEWLAWRHKGIGGSEAPIIMGVSKFKTAKELFEQKINPTPPPNEQNFIHEKGHRLEDIARKNLELETFKTWEPKLFVHQDNERLRCSVDGYNEQLEAIWECKYMGLELYSKLINEELTIKERVPPQYYPQLMHNCFVAGVSRIYFTGIVDNKVLKDMAADQTQQYTLEFNLLDDDYYYIEHQLLPKLMEFIKAVDEKKMPELSEKDTLQTKDNELKKLLTKYKAAKLKAEEYAKKEKELKKQIFDITLKLHNRVECKGFKITQTVSEGTVSPDYEAFLKSNLGNDYKEKLIASEYIKATKPRTTQKITIPK